MTQETLVTGTWVKYHHHLGKTVEHQVSLEHIQNIFRNPKLFLSDDHFTRSIRHLELPFPGLVLC